MKSSLRTILAVLLFAVLAIPASAEEAAPRGLKVETGENGTALSLDGGAPFHRTDDRVSGERLIVVPSTGTRIVLWSETGTDGVKTPFYSIGKAGEAMRPGKRTSYVLKVLHGEFDPAVRVPTVESALTAASGENLYIVQFETQALQDYRDAIESLGGEVLGFLANHAHIVKMPAAVRERVALQPFVRWIGPYQPAYRLERFLRDNRLNLAEAFPLARYSILAFEEGPRGLERLIARLNGLGEDVGAVPAGKYRAEATLSPEQVYRIARWDEVQYIDRWSPLEKDMDIVREIGGANYLETVAGYTGAGVRAEIFDDGFNVNHPDFQSRPLIVHGGAVSTNSHGTATAGINFGDGTGDPQARGLMPDGQGIVADYNNVGLTGSTRYDHTGELLQAPYFAVFQTASVGSARTFDYTTISADHDTLLFDWDVLHCQSQSNSGNQDSRPQAWAKNVLSGGAFNHYNTLTRSDDCWCGTASIGPAQDGRIKPDLSFFYDDTYTTYSSGNGYGQFGGTSGATPTICGYTGLFFQMWSDGIFGNEVDPGGTVFDNRPHMTTAKAFMINTADQHPFSGQSHDLTRVHQGWGVPDIQNVYDLREDISFIDESWLLGNLETVEFNALVDPGAPALKVTMTYADPAGNPASSLHRVNDLTLKVTSPSAVVYWGNHGLLDGNWSVAGGAANDYDTVENVFVENPEEGLWVIEIAANEINQDGHVETPELDADFALVVSGGFLAKCTSDGSISLNRSKYACEDQARVRVVDCDLNTDDATVQTVAVTVWSDTEPTGEVVVLTETDPASATFQELLTLSETDAPGVLQVAHGDTVTAEYIDADDGEGGTNVPKTRQATTDCFGPIITEVSESDVTGASASVTWTTDEESDSTVVWGENTPPDQTKRNPVFSTQHQVQLTGLQECTVYWYEVQSADRFGIASSDDNGGQYYHFETLGDFGQGLQPCHAGQISLDETVVGCSDSLPVRLVDLDLNLSTVDVDTVAIQVSSTTESDPETLVLTETGPNTSIFTGTIATAPGPAVAGDGILQAAGGDLLTATYNDADDGTGSAATVFATGDADCAMDSGTEIRIQNLNDDRAEVRVQTPESTTVVVDWGATAALGTQVSSNTLNTVHTLAITPLTECDRFHFRVTTTDAHGNSAVFDAAGAPFEFNAFEIPGAVFKDEFGTDTGWTLEGEWEIDPPQGLGSGTGDPTAPFDESRVLGHDLTGLGSSPGDYETNVEESAISPSADASALSQVELKFRRRLNVGGGAISFVDVSTGGAWTNVWTSDSIAGQSDSDWVLQTIDVTAEAAGQSSVQVRFRQKGGFSSSANNAGWNVDRFIVRDGSQPDWDACGGCAGAPSFAGLSSAVDADPCADSDVQLSWAPSPSWGSGNGGSYNVYRSTDPGFTPSAGDLVASGVVGTSYNDTSAPNDVTLYYIVRAENNETCDFGPNNSGVEDGNLVRLAVRDDTSQTLPGSLGDTLLVDDVNQAHVRLSWSPVADAATYRVYRSTTGQGPYDLVADVAATSFDDRDRMGDSADAYYKVVAADTCGNEGP